MPRAQQELGQPMPRPELILLGCFPLADKITHRLGSLIGNPNRSQISVPVTACQLQGVPTICLHAISRLLRNQARRHNDAVDSQLGQLPVQCEPCRSRFIAGTQLVDWTKLLDELANRIFPVGDGPRLRTSPFDSETTTAIVSAWTSKPKNRSFSLMTGSSACGSGLRFNSSA